MSHTPGPWYRDGHKDDVVRSVIVRDATGFEVALTRHWGVKETEANANLIAAAPELLKHLQHMVWLVETELKEDGGHIVDGAKAAIAKATGEEYRLDESRAD